VPECGHGAGAYTDVGMAARIELDTRDDRGHPRRGARLSAGAALVPSLGDAPGTFGTVRAEAATYFAPSFPLAPVLALRAGGARAFGPYPWFDAPSVGGESTLRGYDFGRFSGDGAVFAGAELRARLGRFSLGLPGDLGLIVATDAGRVWLDGERSGRWHTSAGGGLWASLVDRSTTFSIIAVNGERTMVYVRGGFTY
jgi:hemolysin activation/secretion protein